MMIQAQPPLLRSLTVVLAALALLPSGCGRKEEAGTKQRTVGFAITTLNNPFFISVKDGAEKAARERGVELIMQSAGSDIDVEKQMQIVENLIQRRVDAICVTPNGAREIVPAIVKATRAGIPVFAIDSKVDSAALQEAGGKVVAFAGSDNTEGGRLAGEYIIRRLGGNGRIAILEGALGHETGDSRLRGFHAAVNSAPGISVVSSQGAAFDRSQGYTVFQNVLQAHPDVQAVFACNDLMALGAVEAIAAMGKTGRIIVVGFDAIDEAREAIRNGQMDATIAQYPEEMGRTAIETAWTYLNGGKVPSFIPVKIELITKENVNSSK
ncbi:MAG TPA: sugar ABC transporter substrate-binding protein [Bacteroidota bacterium]